MNKTQTRIPLLDLKPELELMHQDLEQAFQEVLEHGRFIMGPEVQLFEKNIARYLGVKHAIGVNSGTDALVIALRAAGIGQGDEVITTPFTFFATSESINTVGAEPVFVDIDPETFNLDPDQIERNITGKTKAIVPVHLFGRPAPMAEILGIAERNHLKVIEDCAQSFGAGYKGINAGSNGHSLNEFNGLIKTGTLGDAGAFSFFPSKNLGGFGDGGMITTNSDEIAETAQKLRSHGSRKKYRNELLGYNSRLDTIQAALLNVKLAYIDTFNEKRRDAARKYITALEKHDVIITPALPDDGHVYHQFTIRVKNGKRDKLAKYLDEQGISSAIYYPVPCHRLPVYGNKYEELELPVTEQVCEEVLSLPIGPHLDPGVQTRVMDTLIEGMSEL